MISQATTTLPAPSEGVAAAPGAGRRRREHPPAEKYFLPHCPPGVPIVGRSGGMRRCLRSLQLVARSCCNPVLVTGETGTGKELAARAVHAWRCAAEAPFVAVNCAALSAQLLESELFGHVRGAFTGADRAKPGLFELAGEGTLLLDEISEMPLELQPKLLRVLQERTFRRVGGTETLTCRATIVASSNRDLPAEVREGRFRKDLYYRLAVFPIELPALRSPDRREDIPLLAEYFARHSDLAAGGEACGLSSEALAMLVRHDWPGNVRELRNVIDRALLLEQGGRITSAGIRFDGHGSGSGAGEVESTDRRRPEDFSLEAAEREFILRALKETGWQRTRAASLLGITRATLYAKLKRYGIQPPEARAGEVCA